MCLCAYTADVRLPPGLKRETEVNPPIGKAPPLSSNWAKRGPLSVRDPICHRVSGRAKECVYFVSPPVKDVYIGPGGGGNSAQAIEFPEFLLAERRTETNRRRSAFRTGKKTPGAALLDF